MENIDKLYKDLIDTISEGVYFVDINRRITYWSKGAECITGYKASEVLGSSCFDNILVHVDDEGKELCIVGCPLFDTIRDGQKRSMKVFLHHKDGHRVPVCISAFPMKSPGGQIIGAVELFRDISGVDIGIETAENLKKETLFDPLTGIANRQYLEIKMNSCLEEHARHKIPFGIVMVDINNLKHINETYDYATGDDVLKMVAKTLSGNIQSGDLFGRWDGNGFIGIISYYNVEQLRKLSEKLKLLIEKSFIKKNSVVIKVTVTIGTTVVKHGDSIASIIGRAASLTYQKKDSSVDSIKQSKIYYKHKVKKWKRSKKPSWNLFQNKRGLQHYIVQFLFIFLIILLFSLWIWVIFLK